jgi:hypothetical protein
MRLTLSKNGSRRVYGGKRPHTPERATAPVVHLLDFDRARLYPVAVPARRRARDLERLGRSARKLGLALEERGGWGALREGYGAGWPLPARG